jgi:hypothetical protein
MPQVPLDLRSPREPANPTGLGPLVGLPGSVPLPVMLASLLSFFSDDKGPDRVAHGPGMVVFHDCEGSLRQPASRGSARLKITRCRNKFEHPGSPVL